MVSNAKTRYIVTGVDCEFDDANSISVILTFYVCVYGEKITPLNDIKFNIHIYDRTHFKSVKLETYRIAFTVAAYMKSFSVGFVSLFSNIALIMFTQHALPVVTGFICSPGYYIQVIYAIITLV